MTKTQDGTFWDMAFFRVWKQGNVDELKIPYKDPDIWGAPPSKLKKKIENREFNNISQIIIFYIKKSIKSIYFY